MNDNNVLEAIKTISEYCMSGKCEDCKIKSMCNEIPIMPYCWSTYIKTIEERMTNENIRNS